MSILTTRVDRRSEAFAANRAVMLERLAALDGLVEQARQGGGKRYVDRHHERGKMLPRERIERLLDPDSPFLELSPIAGAETGYPVGGSVVTGIGVVEGVECLVLANDPTVVGGAINPFTLAKMLRGYEIAHENRLPILFLVESGGADLPRQAEIFVPGGATFRQLTRASGARIPTLALVFGNSTAGGAYLPGMSDYVVMVKGGAKVFLGGPPLVKMATGEDADEEELGGAEMHARTSGLADYMAMDELDALRLGRQIVRRLAWRKLGPGPSAAAAEPRHDAEELLGLVPADIKQPLAIREVLARLVDGSEMDEFKPLYGTSLVTGWARLHGYDVGILANERGVLFSEEAQKAAQFIQLANKIDVPLLFVQNVTGYMVGKRYEQGGIIKHGSMMVNAVSNSAVPHLVLQVGGSYGAGNYGMSGRAYRPRFVFLWPSAKTAVMGPEQLAGTLSIVARGAAAAAGKPFDEEADAKRRKVVEDQIERESLPAFTSGRLLDDGILDPRDTRSALGMALSAVHSNEVQGTRELGVFRM